ncbi:casparian strip membrane protein 1-like isoform X1 [Olea europaea var. sylvestris]|uniref:casparian strip membrane protein 1-like isoform X1 n=1 Tax=Olea europaea var. sylvestris TaxID=158386 RepID=UPI000C1CF5AF|nr:casparian strip membrane protein 1-like isoform X1 [Olea europaea var. sylvestris]XP_022877772.1 casparian strip membrane protein 1-like isoform X1 [Olea europaea var. sylvestris]
MKAGGAVEGGEVTKVPGGNRAIAIIDLILRIMAIFGTLASAVAMATTDETLPFITQFIQFKAQYDDIPTFRVFVIVNATVCGYLVLSLAISTFHIFRSRAAKTRAVLIFLDSIMLAAVTAVASAAAAIVYLAHNGNASANWSAICQQFQNFCERISGSLIGSFGAALIFILLIILSAIALCRL